MLIMVTVTDWEVLMAQNMNSRKGEIKSRKREFPVGRLGAHVKGGVSPTFAQYFRALARLEAEAVTVKR